MKWTDCTIRVAKTKALISFVVTAKLICVFVFAYANIRFSHDAALPDLTSLYLLIRFSLLVVLMSHFMILYKNTWMLSS